MTARDPPWRWSTVAGEAVGEAGTRPAGTGVDGTRPHPREVPGGVIRVGARDVLVEADAEARSVGDSELAVGDGGQAELGADTERLPGAEHGRRVLDRPDRRNGGRQVQVGGEGDRTGADVGH